MPAFQDSRLLIASGMVPAAGTTKISSVGSWTVGAQAAGVCAITLPTPGVVVGQGIMFSTNHTASQSQIVDTAAVTKTVTNSTAAGVATNSIFSFEVWQVIPAP